MRAAGGYVVRRKDAGLEVLLIHRRGVWDLPKGKCDDGEKARACARRAPGLVATLFAAMREMTTESWFVSGSTTIASTSHVAINIEAGLGNETQVHIVVSGDALCINGGGNG